MNIVKIYELFPTEADCIAHLENVRWHGVPVCPYCKSDRTTPMPSESRHHCNSCNTTFSITVDTIFHHTHLDLQKWFLAISLVLNAKKGISARQLGRDLEVNKNTAWYMGMRIRNAMFEQGELLRGICEMDETYIGPRRPRKGNKPYGGGSPTGRGTNKIPVVGIVERGGRVIARPVPDKKKLRAKGMDKFIREHVDIAQATLMTAEYGGYFHVKTYMEHKTINHQVCYVNGDIHTNSIEGFWGLLKRGFVGQYHKVSLRHLHQYITEFRYRYNYRNNPAIFELTLSRAVGA
jgi:transposase-like protein